MPVVIWTGGIWIGFMNFTLLFCNFFNNLLCFQFLVLPSFPRNHPEKWSNQTVPGFCKSVSPFSFCVPKTLKRVEVGSRLMAKRFRATQNIAESAYHRNIRIAMLD